MKIKSRKLGIEIGFDIEGRFVCPRQKQRPCMDITMCMGRKIRKYRGCVTCSIPNQISRALERVKVKKFPA